MTAYSLAERGLKIVGVSDIEPSELLVSKCDVPAAIERVITSENASMIKCRILAEGANGPTTPEADAVLPQRGDEIFVLPDILCKHPVEGRVAVTQAAWLTCYFGCANSRAEVRRAVGPDVQRCAPGRRRARLVDPRRSFWL